MGIEIEIGWLTALMFGSLMVLLMAGLPLAFVTGGLACVFLFILGYHQLGAAVELNSQFTAEVGKHLQTLDVKAGFQTAGLYIEAGVHYTAVGLAYALGNIPLFFDKGGVQLIF